MPKIVTWEEYKEQVQAGYDQKGKLWTVIGYVGEWKGKETKLICHCADHGEWSSTTIANAKKGWGCGPCGRERTIQGSVIDDSIHIEAFNKASPDNVPRKYIRSERLNKEGYPVFWFVECSKCSHDEYVKAGLCNGKFESLMSSLKKGSLVCRCAKHYYYTPDQWIHRMTKACQERGDQFVGFVGKISNNSKFKYLCSVHGEQIATPNNYLKGRGCPGCKNRNQQEFYINAIVDEYGEDTGAYKLGIAKDSDIRLKTQNAKNNYSMKRVALFDMPSYQICRETESLLKSKDVVPSIGYVERLHMKDGASETFHVDDLQLVIDTIEKAGGYLKGGMMITRTYEEATEYAVKLCEGLGYIFLGWEDDTKTKAKSLFNYLCPCSEHGIRTSCIDRMSQGKKCNLCMNVFRGKAATKRQIGTAYNLKPDLKHISDFMQTGVFHKDTIFKRAKRKGYWFVVCPICSGDEYVKAGLCDGEFEAFSVDLKKGNRPCRCSRGYKFTSEQWTYKIQKQCNLKGYTFISWVDKIGVKCKFVYRCELHGDQVKEAGSFLSGTGCPECVNKTQQECYINQVFDEDGDLCALKLGIANDSKIRVKGQNSKNIFQMQQVQVWEFPTVKQCKDAETMLKNTLTRGVITKFSMYDGNTETVDLQCLPSIINVYILFGGILKQEEIC